MARRRGQTAYEAEAEADRGDDPMGRVVKISAAELVDPKTNLPFFNIEIEMPGKELARLAVHQKLVPGMPVEVFIRTYSRTPLEILARPLMDSLRHALREG